MSASSKSHAFLWNAIADRYMERLVGFLVTDEHAKIDPQRTISLIRLFEKWMGVVDYWNDRVIPSTDVE